jgi:hypothetical protein
MANRSDMQAALPRHIKRYLTMGNWANAHEYGEIKRMMIDSQNVYRAFKSKRRESNRDLDGSSDE